MKKLLLPVTLALLAGAGPLLAQVVPVVPEQMNYQGQVVDTVGNPKPDGQYTLSISIWSDAFDGTNSLWGPQIFDSQNSAGHGPQVNVINGHFNVVLGPQDSTPANRPLSAVFAANTNCFLEITFGTNGPTVLPRQQILSAPFAFQAANSGKLAGFGWDAVFPANTFPSNNPLNLKISGNRIQDASIMASQIANGAVGTAQITNGAVGPAQIQIPLALISGNDVWLLSASNSAGPGIAGFSAVTHGVFGSGLIGVYGASSARFGIGVRGEAKGGAGIGVYAEGDPGLSVHSGSSAPAAEFFGDVIVSGSLKAVGKDFRIDHPLAPAEKYLSHSAIESSERKTMYDGIAILDSHGQATVELASWFEPLNKDFRYQLTAIGAAAPNLHIAEEISNRHFKIAGGLSGLKVSWQVTGIRQDAWANANPISVEQDKAPSERGFYLAPEAHGQPKEKGIGWAKHPDRNSSAK